jgi:hypothetical protein
MGGGKTKIKKDKNSIGYVKFANGVKKNKNCRGWVLSSRKM